MATNLEWAPDGIALLIRGGSYDYKEVNLYVAKAPDWQMRLLHCYRDEKSVAFFDYYALWSPDGQTVLFTSQEDGWNHLYSVPADGGEAKQLTKGEWEVTWVAWPKNSEKSIYASTEVHTAERHFYILSPDTGESFRLQTPEGMNNAVDITKDGSLIVFAHEDFFLPTEIWGIAAQEDAKPNK
jgi:dipeptidyl aminopeptidase/acylaminoacyl peptidase